jgi:hypothetical protein
MNKNNYLMSKSILAVFVLLITNTGLGMEMLPEDKATKQAELAYEREIGLTSGEKTDYNVWLDVTNLEEKQSFKVRINSPLLTFKKEIEPTKSMSKLVQLEKINNSLSVLPEVKFSNKNGDLLLTLEVSRDKNPGLPRADFYTNLHDEDSLHIDKSSCYDEPDNNYVIDIRLKGADLTQTTYSVHPATEKHLAELKKKGSGIIERLRESGSKIFSKSSSKSDSPER